uniref:Uncharacterized protein n=1 Tax=Varanus komodoensis TaxID=61221 RepID=A0A8D2L502_VARKO
MLEAAGPDPELDPEDLVHFSVGDLPSRGYGVMGEIRRQGKLCDVTLKVPAPAGSQDRHCGCIDSCSCSSIPRVRVNSSGTWE